MYRRVPLLDRRWGGGDGEVVRGGGGELSLEELRAQGHFLKVEGAHQAHHGGACVFFGVGVEVQLGTQRGAGPGLGAQKLVALPSVAFSCV